MRKPTSVARILPLLIRAARAREGYCMLCECTYESPCQISGDTCRWVEGTRWRVCNAHTEEEIKEAVRMLRRTDARGEQYKEGT